MILNPKIINKKEGRFNFGANLSVLAPVPLCNQTLAEIWSGFCLRQSKIEFIPTNQMNILIGDASPIPYSGYEYSINVEEKGIAISAKDTTGLIHGFLTLLELINTKKLNEFSIECCNILDAPSLKNRMVHICIFPETDINFIKRVIRLCGLLKYSHMIIEFWGMYQYNCLKELSWNNAFTKEELLPVFKEAEHLGMQLIPMLNHLGHASQCRLFSGKHVVLDQNPSLAGYFEQDGWAWDIKNEETHSLLRKMREELITLFPKAEFFHLGCDEVYSYTQDINKANQLVKYINSISEELNNKGLRAIIWGDMLIHKDAFEQYVNKYEFNLENHDINMLATLDKNIIIADWQYHATKAPLLSSLHFAKHGFDTMCCPWSETDNIKANANTAIQNNLFGVICTTWHTLNEKMPYLLVSAKECWQGESDIGYVSLMSTAATALRKVHFAEGVYKNCGWMDKQIK